MNKKRWLVIIAIAAICITAGLMLTRPSQPGLKYKGKSVEEWSAQLYASPDEGARKVASAALKEMGPKAIPDLIRMLQRKDPFIRRQLWSLSVRLPIGLQRQMLKGVKPLRAPFAHIAAMHALAEIGPDANPAIADLARALQGKDLQETWEASTALGKVGPDAVRVLVAALPSQNGAVVQAALAALAQIGPAAGSAVPSVIEKLGDQDQFVRERALLALVGIGQPAVPQLLKTVEQGKGEVRRGAAKALVKIDPSRRKLSPAFLQMLKDEEPASRLKAIESLTAVYATDEATVRAVTDALQDRDANVREAATNALSKLQAKEGL